MTQEVTKQKRSSVMVSDATAKLIRALSDRFDVSQSDVVETLVKFANVGALEPKFAELKASKVSSGKNKTAARQELNAALKDATPEQIAEALALLKKKA